MSDAEPDDARRALLSVLRARVINIAEMQVLGFAACGVLCPGGSARRGCDCLGPKECRMKAHPAYQRYVEYRAGQMSTNWFVAPPAGGMVLVKMTYACGEAHFDTEMME